MRTPIIEVKNLKTEIKDTVIHDGLDMTVYKGEIFGVVGGSGSGKTVLLNTLLQLMPYKSGSIKILGAEGEEISSSAEIKKKWGVLFQHGALFSSLTVLQNICVPILEQSKVPPDVAQQIAYYKLLLVGLPADSANKIPEELSGGMIKRAALARALAFDAELVFLDEPTSGLDPISADAFDKLLKSLQSSLGLTVVMITHDLGSLAMCDRLGVILDKKMVMGTLDEIRKSPHPWIQEYFEGPRATAVLKR
jgi:phospholipid/cholesterol/gamma-HCH transport system ATP-binding protein